MRAKILVIDDEHCMRELMGMHLQLAGHDVLVAEDAIVGGYLLLAQRPDLVLVDIEMPYMTGLEFVKAVKSDEGTRSIPIIICSTRDDAELEGRQLGAVAFLTKPVRADHLLATVAKYVDGRIPL